jgi:hypothetical protein
MSLNGSGAAIFSGSVTARGPKSQIIADGNSVGAGILLSNSIVGSDRRNWGIFTEQDVAGDFVIKRSTSSGGDAQTGTTILSLLNTGAATFSSTLQVNSYQIINGASAGFTFLQFNNNGTPIGYTGSAAAIVTGGSASDYALATAQNIVFGTGGSFTEKMRITSGGNVGIGATPSAWSDFKVLEFANGVYLGTYTGGGQTLYLGANNYFNGSDYIYKVSGYATRYQQTSGAHQWFISTISGTAGNVASFTQAMALLTNGNLLIGRTTSGLNNTEGVTISGGSIQLEATSYVMYGNRTTSDGLFMGIRRNNVDVGSITVTTSSTAFNTSSDYRLKQDLKEFNGLSIINSIKTYDYEWKIDNTRAYGVIAHELEEILPYAVFGKKDEINENGNIKPQAVDYSKLVPILIKSIQELEARIKQLENK